MMGEQEKEESHPPSIAMSGIFNNINFINLLN
jgi:hypothetical protein